MKLRLKKVVSDKDVKNFIRLPYELYKNTPQWIPPLNSMVKKAISKGAPVMSGGREFFLVMNAHQPVGRLGVYINKNVLKHGNNVGSFTLFESYDDLSIVDLLFHGADNWFKEMRIEKYIGTDSPTNGDDYKAILIKNFDDPPFINMNYNPPYYQRLLEEIGFAMKTHLACFKYDLSKPVPEKIIQLIEIAKKRYDYEIISPQMRNLKKVARDLKTVMENSIPDYWVGVRPPSFEEMLQIVKDMKRFADPDLVAIAYHGDEPIGFAASIPNYNEVLKELNGRLYPFGWLKFLKAKKEIKTFRTFTVFVVEKFQGKGVSFAMHYHVGMNAIKKGYTMAEGGIIGFENKKSFQDALGAGGELYKEYATFEKKV
ncbi:MAG: N-acetyltransferase [Thermotogae bacterium]|nr:MAG: N-acetyltransferase [Thermotogota bacterium]